ncbi:hypothetical protein SRHO_G00336530 [Serrasalmus rhombeus]
MEAKGEEQQEREHKIQPEETEERDMLRKIHNSGHVIKSCICPALSCFAFIEVALSLQLPIENISEWN